MRGDGEERRKEERGEGKRKEKRGEEEEAGEGGKYPSGCSGRACWSREG